MSLSDLKTYSRDCYDYQTLTNYTDNQIVLQMRMNMDSDLKRSIDLNHSDWRDKTVIDAVKIVNDIIKQSSNPTVYRKEFDNMVQESNESIREFVTRLRSCAADCSFACPYDAEHDLTDYHIINKIRSGIKDPRLQQELLQKHSTLTALTDIIQYGEEYESAKRDQEKLSDRSANLICGIENLSFKNPELQDVCEDEMVAAISAYRSPKNKSNNKPYRQTDKIPYRQTDKINCSNCGYQHI